MKDTPIIAEKSPAGVEVEEGKTYYWCRCGRSQDQPFCDGSHAGTDMAPLEFTADKSATVQLCRCKGTADPPYGDGTHARLSDLEVGAAVPEEAGGDARISVELDSMPPYQVTLAFELEELPGGRTRLIERIRTSVDVSENQKRARPVLAMGLFVFLKSQLEGIKERAEGAVVIDA